ncbi:MAG TPA: PaaI family thioesterase [Chloroflexia bacterium]|nr:PaaI family thioesterase [Chloroflexia bacterium]
MTLAVTEQELQQLLAESDFVKMYGFELVSFEEGHCILRVPFQKVFERPGGVVNGPVYMAVADLAIWFAVITLIGREEGDMSVTTELNTAFLSGGRGDVTCKARILKLGRRLIYGVAECMDEKGKLLTHHTATYIRPHKKGSNPVHNQ